MTPKSVTNWTGCHNFVDALVAANDSANQERAARLVRAAKDFEQDQSPEEALEILGGDDAIKSMGLFLRSLASLYAVMDCERFVEDMRAFPVPGGPDKMMDPS